MEPEVLAVTEIARDAWPALRLQLEAARILMPESVPGWDMPFLWLHPGLDAHRELSSPEEQERLSALHRRRYYGLANLLYNLDIENPQQARAMARLEAPNFLRALRSAFAAADPDVRDFGDSVLRLLLGVADEELRQEKLPEARRAYEESQAVSGALGNSAMEAVAWHQLGLVFQESQDWPEAERCYREALRIREANGLIRGLNGAVATWNQLGYLSERAGDAAAAESLYRKALEACRLFETPLELAMVLSNLAGLLVEQPARLREAREAAEEALLIKLDLDPAVARIWTTYTILALVADRQSRPDDAQRDRLLALEAQRSFAARVTAG